jgi:hypothetical protein
MQESHTRAAVSARFDDESVVAHAGVVPLLRIARDAGLATLAEQRLHLSAGSAGANPAAKILSIVAGMAAGADCIDDLDVLRHGAMDRIFDGVRAPSTLGTFLRGFEIGHATALEAIAAQVLIRLVGQTPGLADGIGQYAVLDLDSKVTPVYGPQKVGAGRAYTGQKGYHFLAATLTSPLAAPVILATRLRGGSADTRRRATSFLTQALRTARRCGATGPLLVRADSGYFVGTLIRAIIAAGARFSITVPMRAPIQAAIDAIPEHTWQPITYARPVFDPDTQTWIHTAEIAETTYTAFANPTYNPGQKTTARLIARRVRVPAHNEQAELFFVWRYHAIFTNTLLNTVDAEQQHRDRAGAIEPVFAELNDSAARHLPSGQFHANAAWLTLAALTHNLLRALGVSASRHHAKARIGTLRRQLITIPARITRTARRLTLRLPANWPWADSWMGLFTATTHPLTT